MPTLHFLVPGDWFLPTGGYTYDRRMALALQALGWTVEVAQIGGPWPNPDADLLSRTEHWLQQRPDQSLVLADGLAFGALPELAQRHADRLRWLALVHHPLHLETGLGPAERHRLQASEARALRHARGVVVTSARTVQDVVALGVAEHHVAVVEPGTDRKPTAGHGPRAREPGPLRLLCVATVTPRKGHGVLLEALAGLAGSGWELHNVGSLQRDPAHAQRLQALSASSAMAEQVHWHGEVDDDALADHYARSDLFVLPSLYEGFGMVVTEAVAHGLPVIATDGGALASTLPAGAGLTVPAGNADALRDALQRVIHNPDLRQQLAAGARTAAQHLPDWNAQAARLSQWLHTFP